MIRPQRRQRPKGLRSGWGVVAKNNKQRNPQRQPTKTTRATPNAVKDNKQKQQERSRMLSKTHIHALARISAGPWPMGVLDSYKCYLFVSLIYIGCLKGLEGTPPPRPRATLFFGGVSRTPVTPPPRWPKKRPKRPRHLHEMLSFEKMPHGCQQKGTSTATKPTRNA